MGLEGGGAVSLAMESSTAALTAVANVEAAGFVTLTLEAIAFEAGDIAPPGAGLFPALDLYPSLSVFPEAA